MVQRLTEHPERMLTAMTQVIIRQDSLVEYGIVHALAKAREYHVYMVRVRLRWLNLLPKQPASSTRSKKQSLTLTTTSISLAGSKSGSIVARSSLR
jgi:hypothetical protein